MTSPDALLQSYRELAVRSDLTALVFLALGSVVAVQVLAVLYRTWSELFIEVPYRIRHGHSAAAVVALLSLMLLFIAASVSTAAVLQSLSSPLLQGTVWGWVFSGATLLGEAMQQWSGLQLIDAAPLGLLSAGLLLHAVATLSTSIADVPRKRAQAKRAQQMLERLSAGAEESQRPTRSTVKYR